MSLTDTVPSVPLKNYKRTKIIATVGPSTDSYEAILALIKAGANGIRLNFSHGTHEERTKQIKWIRKAAKEAVDWQRGEAIREHEESRAAILAQGCELAELPRQAHDEFVKAVQPLHEDARKSYGTQALALL